VAPHFYQVAAWDLDRNRVVSTMLRVGLANLVFAIAPRMRARGAMVFATQELMVEGASVYSTRSIFVAGGERLARTCGSRA